MQSLRAQNKKIKTYKNQGKRKINGNHTEERENSNSRITQSPWKFEYGFEYETCDLAMDLEIDLAIDLAMEGSTKWMAQFNVWIFKGCQWDANSLFFSIQPIAANGDS